MRLQPRKRVEGVKERRPPISYQNDIFDVWNTYSYNTRGAHHKYATPAILRETFVGWRNRTLGVRLVWEELLTFPLMEDES
jgi:hypothetical protein